MVTGTEGGCDGLVGWHLHVAWGSTQLCAAEKEHKRKRKKCKACSAQLFCASIVLCNLHGFMVGFVRHAQLGSRFLGIVGSAGTRQGFQNMGFKRLHIPAYKPVYHCLGDFACLMYCNHFGIVFPLLCFCAFPLLRFSAFALLRFCAFPLSRFPAFPLFHFPAFLLFRFSCCSVQRTWSSWHSSALRLLKAGQGWGTIEHT